MFFNYCFNSIFDYLICAVNYNYVLANKNRSSLINSVSDFRLKDY